MRQATARARPSASDEVHVVRRVAYATARAVFVLAVYAPIGVLLASHLAGGPVEMGAITTGEGYSIEAAARTPSERLTEAATAFAATAAGAGMTFQVAQSSVLYAKPGGPLIEIPHPTDRYRSLGYTDRYYVGGLIADGGVAGDGFYLLMGQGPAIEGGVPDVDGQLEMAALTRDGKTWRNDGIGWYETTQPPGIGLDTATVALLPRLLRQATAATDAGTKAVDGRTAAVIRASGTVANAPGILAIDGAPFTELREPFAFALDDQGRLVELSAVERNTNSDVFDLIVTTTITFRYGAIPAMPLPEPLAPPPLPPAPEPEAER